MAKRALALTVLSVFLLSISAGAWAAEPVAVDFLAGGPVLTVAPEGYEGEPADNPLNGQMLGLKFQKKVDGRWVTKVRRSREIVDGIVYGDPTPTYNRGRCRIVASYAGDGTYASARKANLYDCKTGALIYQ